MSILPRTTGIYKITCTVTGKIYVGSAVDIGRRWSAHRSGLIKGNHRNIHLQRAWNKYDECTFAFEVIETCSHETLIEREQHYLSTLKPFPPIGFNIAFDASRPLLGRTHSPEARAKISATFKGKKLSPEHVDKLREASKNMSPENRAKINASKKGRKYSPEAKAKAKNKNKGRKASPEVRARMSASRMGIVFSDEHRENLSKSHMGYRIPLETREKLSRANSKTYVVTSPDGVEMTITNLCKFCSENGLAAQTMSHVANGKRNHHKGWHCRHAE